MWSISARGLEGHIDGTTKEPTGPVPTLVTAPATTPAPAAASAEGATDTSQTQQPVQPQMPARYLAPILLHISRLALATCTFPQSKRAPTRELKELPGGSSSNGYELVSSLR